MLQAGTNKIEGTENLRYNHYRKRRSIKQLLVVGSVVYGQFSHTEYTSLAHSIRSYNSLNRKPPGTGVIYARLKEPVE